MAQIKIGWAEVSITPEKKISLAGQFAERISEYVEKELTATAMAVEADGEQMVLVSTDLVGVDYGLTKKLREVLADNTVGLDPKKVIFSAIHTHTGPGYPRGQYSSLMIGAKGGVRGLLLPLLRPGQNYVEKANVSQNPDICTGQEIFDLLVERISKVVLEAWANRKDGSFVNAFGRAAVGLCRRACYNDGSAQMWGDTDSAMFTELEAGSDSGIELMFVYDDAKKLRGIVANLACPAQCVQHRLFVSPDFWGEVKVLLREKFGEDIFLLPLCSAAGDQCPVDLIRFVNPESPINDPNCERENPLKRKADPSMFDLAGMKRVGRRIAREIIDTYEECADEAQADVPFEHRVHIMNLPLRRTTLAEINKAKSAIRDYLNDHPGDVDYNDVAKLQVYTGTLRRAKVQEMFNTIPVEVHVIRLGSIAIATNPFELFLDYGNQIKVRSHAEQTFLVQLACGTEGYLPTEKAEKGGHYSAFISSGQVGHQGGDQLVRETLQSINELFPR